MKSCSHNMLLKRRRALGPDQVTSARAGGHGQRRAWRFPQALGRTPGVAPQGRNHRGPPRSRSTISGNSHSKTRIPEIFHKPWGERQVWHARRSGGRDPWGNTAAHRKTDQRSAETADRPRRGFQGVRPPGKHCGPPGSRSTISEHGGPARRGFQGVRPRETLRPTGKPINDQRTRWAAGGTWT